MTAAINVPLAGEVGGFLAVPSAGRILGRTLAAAVLATMAATAMNAGGRAAGWETIHWDLAALLATWIAVRSAPRATGPERTVRLAVAFGLAIWSAGQALSTLELATGGDPLSGPANACFALAAFPPLGGLVVVARVRAERTADRVTRALDGALLVLGTLSVIVTTYGARAMSAGGPPGSLGLLYPIVFIAAAGVGLVVAFAGSARWPCYAVLGGSALIGLAWLLRLSNADDQVRAGTIGGYLFSVAVLLIAQGAAHWTTEELHAPRLRRLAASAQHLLPVFAVAVAMLDAIVSRDPAIERLVELIAFGAGGLFVARQWLVLLNARWLRDARRRAEAALPELADERAAMAPCVARLTPGPDLAATPEAGASPAGMPGSEAAGSSPSTTAEPSWPSFEA